MVNQDRPEDFESLMALLTDIEKELASTNEEDKGKIRELRQHCLLKLALLKKEGEKDPD